jgi:hypothetical protein
VAEPPPKAFDEMTKLDHTISGSGGKHLINPDCDVGGIIDRLVADLDHLSQRFDQLSRRHDLTARMIISSMRDSVDDAGRRIKEMTDNAKTKKSSRRGTG